jgi:hypothetical protein
MIEQITNKGKILAIVIANNVKKISEKLTNSFPPYNFIIDKYSIIERMSMCFSKGALNKSNLNINSTVPFTWEFSVFSQNGEDGIIDFLLSYIKNPNRYFIEIGSSDGLENNSSYLAFAKKYSGIMIEGNYSKSLQAKRYLQRFNWGVKYINSFVNKDNVGTLLKKESLLPCPDFFSLDIDGIDYFVMEAILYNNFRPKIICVEYNSIYGPEKTITIRYKSNFDYANAHPTHFYYGVSINGWRKFFKKFNYDFITVDTNGVNAFFIDRGQFDESLPNNFKSVGFVENFALRNRFGNTWIEQFEIIKNMNYYEI